VTATGETGIQGQLLGRLTVRAQQRELSTLYIGIYVYIPSLKDLHIAQLEKGSRMRSLMLVVFM